MKKQVLLFLILNSVAIGALFAQNEATGNPAEDAVSFLSYYKNNKQKEMFALLAYYFNKPSVDNTTAPALLQTNIFLKIYATDAKLIAAVNSAPAASPNGLSTSSFGLGSVIADGTAQFLIERGKQELSMAFFDQFQKDLKKYPELSYLFPHTMEIIENIQNHNITTLLQELRDAFMKDLLKMPENILSLRNIDEASCLKNKDCEERVKKIKSFFSNPNGKDSRIAVVPLLIMQGIIDGNNTLEVLDNIIADKSTYGKADALSGYFQFTSVLLQSLKSSQERDGIFINTTALKTLFSSDELFNVFLGLTLQKYRDLPGYNNLDINGKKLEDILSALKTSQAEVLNVVSIITKINTHFLAIKKQLEAGKEIDNTSYASLISYTIKSFPAIINMVHDNTSLSLPADFDKLKKYLLLASDLCSDIQQRNYAGIFNATISFITQNEVFEDKTVNEKVVKYLAFAANLASSKTAAEVKEAINSVALPPGSYSIKQKSLFNISFNGYIGYAWDINGGLYANGISAPVGFSASVGLGKKYGGAVSLFASIVDVGSIVAYRLKNNTTDDLKQEVRLESIVSPSAQLLFEVIPRTPIAFGFGWRKTSKLFYSSQTSFITVQPKNVFNISVLIDIPIFTIKNIPFN